ncbi:MAG: tRNA pseudouridine(55) synthase TruB [Alphaproteobacteria bacterium]|nr:tRNA pseudouridine(55) synthase TruB [Alphaproteobacteria bacterium]MBU1514257.1 tRNA pseudouridine(55) synthase TruB [Alphaproteobacteria bacterium]MBU2093297.1 tRNA pseudouridine(55) synthase TruB [Alphaproteobacteria bacterium]MBU2153388.1 tRNA pseudouridine(55) synthase TruB [Alphaproteobacteria bacterium]MBU2309021.1 tRNA pseudouridine(55) synthase TruB [Alphaproteobacteria bacterium]
MARRKKGQAISGWINLDKPYDLTSTHAVGRIRRLFDAQKAGHAGTLDPLATGILPIALGEATKTVPFLVDADKAYRFTIAWGRTTTTLDREGETVAESDVRPGVAEVEAVLPRFVGEIDQIPPAYSAIKVDGERAYDLARAGETVELASRKVNVFAARVVEAPDADHITLEIECGKGTYVRAIVRDIAEALGACGHVSALRRTRVGQFTEQSAVALEMLENLSYEARLSEALLPVETALDDIPVLAVTDEDAFRLKQGRSVVLVPRQVEAVKARLKPGSRTVSAMAGGSMVALCEMRAGRLEPSRVFNL